MRLIPLSGGKDFAKVDDSDYEALSQFNWTLAVRKRKDGTVRKYAIRTCKKSEKWTSESMHGRLVGELPKGLMVDHEDGDGLNNQRDNLRSANHAQNMMNKGKGARGTSKYKGVYKNPNSEKWRAVVSLGSYDTEEDAARAYDAAINRLHGEFARFNLPR